MLRAGVCQLSRHSACEAFCILFWEYTEGVCKIIRAWCGVCVDTYLLANSTPSVRAQAPKGKYSFMALVGRKYLLSFVDQNFIRATADVHVSATKMRADEVILLQFSHRPPLYPRLPMRASVYQTSVELWGELEPQVRPRKTKQKTFE